MNVTSINMRNQRIGIRQPPLEPFDLDKRLPPRLETQIVVLLFGVLTSLGVVSICTAS